MSDDQDVNLLVSRISDFLTSYRTSISEIASQVSHVFEAMCFVIFARYYEETGYQLTAENLLEGKFRFRYYTSGYPWNYSYFSVASIGNDGKAERTLFEIRHNQLVAGAWVESDEAEEQAFFAVDVAVIKAGSLPKLQPGARRTDERYWVNNQELITFAESKKLKAYPMLLAQFLGTIHEIKPEFIKAGTRRVSRKFRQQKHPPPTLLTTDKLTPGTSKVLQSFKKRKLRLRVIENVIGASEDTLLAQLRGIASDAP